MRFKNLIMEGYRTYFLDEKSSKSLIGFLVRQLKSAKSCTMKIIANSGALLAKMIWPRKTRGRICSVQLIQWTVRGPVDRHGKMMDGFWELINLLGVLLWFIL